MSKATEAAIEAAIVAHTAEDHPGAVVTGWIVLAATISTDGDGDEISGVDVVLPGAALPWTHALGIIEAARIRMHRAWAGD
jgi:hypothetical protein